LCIRDSYVRGPGRFTWSGAAGRARISPAVRMRPGDRFPAGSIVKTFVATATLQLAEEGRFGLDDTLPAVLPRSVVARIPEAGRITVRMLLNHTSGIGDYDDAAFDQEVVADPLRRWKVSELLDRAAAHPRTGAPGERFSYSNTNYNVLGLIIEHATGKTWRAVIRERIFRPLHLRHTSLPRPGHIPAGRDIAHGYTPLGGTQRDITRVDPSMAGAAGGHALFTTTRDLARFNRALLAGRLFQRRATLKAMRAFLPAPEPYGRVGYGLGLERWVLPGGLEMIGNLGSAGGYRALVFRLPAQRTEVAIFINSDGDPTPALVPALKLLAARAS
jgi:D-alanyl-D-alanine carboxypeptidase